MPRNGSIDPHGWFEGLRKRPAMYLGRVDVACLDNFLFGYTTAAHRYGGGSADDPLLLPDDFLSWVAYRLRFDGVPSVGLFGMLSQRCDVESEAVSLYLDLLTEHRTRSPHIVARLTGCTKRYQSDGIERCYPQSIALTTYTDDPGFFATSETDDSFPRQPFFATIEDFQAETHSIREDLTIIDPSWTPPTRKS